jgi:hypothetical protein
MAIGRGRLTAIEMLPRECAEIVAWAAGQLRMRERTQSEIYEEFYTKLAALQKEHRGELDFSIPSFSAFNRYSIRLATLTRRLEDTREIAGAVAAKFDARASDDLTLIASEAIKTLVFELTVEAGEAGMAPKEAMQLANALRAASQAQGVSTARRTMVEKNFKQGVEAALDKVAKVKGLSDSTVESIKAGVLGIDPAHKSGAATYFEAPA